MTTDDKGAEQQPTHLTSSPSAQEYGREPGVAKIYVAELMSFYDFLNTYLTYLIICFASPQQIRNRQ